MISFRQSPKSRNYLSRREQWRLLTLVMGLGLVIVLMLEAGKPENWHWFTMLAGEEQNAPAGETENPGESEAVDNRLAPRPPDQDVPGTFVSPAPRPMDAEVDRSGRYFPGVKPGLLEAVRDDTPFRSDEQHAWFHLFDVLNRTTEQTLEEKSTGRATYAQLFRQPGQYRGEVVTVRGVLRRAHPVTPRKNEYGIERYYRTWLWPDDNPTSPMVVFCLSLPQDFPTGMAISEDVQITAFFYKRWAYRAKDGLRTAPTLLAKAVRWEPKPAPDRSAPTDLGSMLLLIVIAAVLSAVVAVYVYRQTRPVPATEEEQPPRFDALSEVDVPSDVGVQLDALQGEREET